MALVRSVGIIGGLTLIARVAGYVRDLFIAAFMGAGAVSDAFFVAFRIPNFLRRVFAEGAFSAAFVPLFAGKLATDGRETATRFAEETQSFLLAVLLGITVLAEIFMPELIHLFTPGFAADPEKFELAVTLTRITFPYLVFISLVALYGGVLNSLEKFAAFAAAPILLNLVMIVSIAGFGKTAPTPAHALSYGVMVAGAIQLSWMLYACHRMGLHLKLGLPRLTAGVKRLITTMVPAIIGASVAQINLLVDTIIASLIPGAVSYLYYADRISQLPLGVIGVAVGTALLPMLSKSIQQGDMQDARTQINRGIELTTLLCLPAAVALVVIAEPIISVLFERGAFDSASATATAQALAALSFGLPAFVLVKVFLPGFYAAHDTKTPLKIALFCIGLNIALNGLFYWYVPALKHTGIALATSLSSWANAGIMAFLLHRRTVFEPDDRLRRKLGAIGASSLAMGLVLAASLLAAPYWPVGGTTGKALLLLIQIGGGFGVFALAAHLTKAADVQEIRAYIAQARRNRAAKKSAPEPDQA